MTNLKASPELAAKDQRRGAIRRRARNALRLAVHIGVLVFFVASCMPPYQQGPYQQGPYQQGQYQQGQYGNVPAQTGRGNSDDSDYSDYPRNSDGSGYSDHPRNSGNSGNSGSWMCTAEASLGNAQGEGPMNYQTISGYGNGPNRDEASLKALNDCRSWVTVALNNAWLSGDQTEGGDCAISNCISP